MGHFLPRDPVFTASANKSPPSSRICATNGSINKGGHYQSDNFRLSAEVKDSSRFKDKWEYFAFPSTGEPAEALPKSAGCYACHSAHGAVENTFVQFYPTLLPVAKSKGTLKAANER